MTSPTTNRLFDGTSWQLVSDSGPRNSLYGLGMVDCKALYAVGLSGTIMKNDGCTKIGAEGSAKQPNNAAINVTSAIENQRSSTWLASKYGVAGNFTPKTAVREFTATTNQNGEEAIFGFRFTDVSGVVGDLELMKLKDDGTSLAFSNYDAAGGVASPEGTWWVQTTASPAVILSKSATFNAGTYYDLRFVVEDNGAYDLDTRLGFIRDPFVLGSTGAGGSASGSGGGTGCTMSRGAGSPGEMLVLLVIAAGCVACGRRRSNES